MNNLPKTINEKNIPHSFCPGCGHPIALRAIASAIEKMALQAEAVVGLDIGCSLLAWNFYNLDSFQTHHGRTVATLVGYKRANPNSVAIAYQGDGGAYAIGLQSLITSAHRDDPLTVVVINNTLYAMTGGQMAPTTVLGEKTTTTPRGRNIRQGPKFLGPETIKQVASERAYIARGTIENSVELEMMIRKAIERQRQGHFAFVEVLSACPVNWKTTAKETFERLGELKTEYRLGELNE